VNQNEETLSFSPINGAHAIAEVTVFLRFEPQLNASTISKLLSLEEELKDFFPTANETRAVQFKITGTGEKQDVSDNVAGIELKSMNQEGGIDWMMRTAENSISVHCLNYSTWEEVSEQMLKCLNATFKHLDGSESFVSNIGLMYVDRFICNGDNDEANLKDLLKQETDWVFKGAFKSVNNLWHSHIGWYEDFSDYKLLNQLKISSSYANIKGEKKLVVTADHNVMLFREDVKGSFVTYSDDSDNSIKLKGNIDTLHAMNKKVLKELLTSQMVKRINL